MEAVQPQAAPAAASGLGSADGSARCFSNLLWDLLRSVTGFTRTEVDALRERDEGLSPTPDVVDLVTADLKWTDARLLHTLREDLQQYVDVLRQLKDENARRAQRTVKVKSFVEDKRYAMLREREASMRITSRSIELRFKALDFSRRKLQALDAGLVRLHGVEQLDLRENQLLSLAHVPPNSRIVMASANAISSVSTEALARCASLLYLALSCNALRDVTFLRASSSLVYVDLSYNGIDDLTHVIEVLHTHPTVRDCNFTGNPMTLARNYRALLARSTPLERLDELDICDADRTAPLHVPPPAAAPSSEVEGSAARRVSTESSVAAAVDAAHLPPAAPSAPQLAEAPVTTFDIVLKLLEVQGAATIAPPPVDDIVAQRAAATGKGAPPKDAKKGEKDKPKEPSASNLTAKRFALSLHTDWAGIRVQTSPQETTPPPAMEDSSALGAKGKLKKGLVEAPAVTDTVAIGVSEVRTLGIDAATVWSLQKPLTARLVVSDLASDAHFDLGRFDANLAAVVEAKHGTPVRAVAPLVVSRNTIADMDLALGKQREQLAKLTAVDAALDRELQSASTPIPTKEEPVAAGKKSAPAKAAPGKSQVSDELVHLQNESAARKAEIEDLQVRLMYEERVVAKLRGAAMCLAVEVIINPPYVMPVKAAPPPEADTKKDGRKKK